MSVPEADKGVCTSSSSLRLLENTLSLQRKLNILLNPSLGLFLPQNAKLTPAHRYDDKTRDFSASI